MLCLMQYDKNFMNFSFFTNYFMRFLVSQITAKYEKRVKHLSIFYEASVKYLVYYEQTKISKDEMWIKWLHFKIKFMIKIYFNYIQKHFLLLNIQINKNLQSRCVVKNANQNKLIWSDHAQFLKKQGNIVTKIFTARSALVTPYNWMNWVNIPGIIWKVFQSKPQCTV